jgi:hypothetical protein
VKIANRALVGKTEGKTPLGKHSTEGRILIWILKTWDEIDSSGSGWG